MAQGSTTNKVTATDLDIRDLTSSSDSVAAAQSGTWNITNISGTVSLPTGASTGAKQDSTNALLTTIDADTSTLAGAVSGTEVQVDIVGALPAGTNAIGKLAANSGVDIGDTDVTSIIPGTGATNLGKAIDTATGATDTGVLALVTRDDALATLTPADGDNTQLRVDSTGALWIKPSGTITVDGSGVTQPVSNAGLTELAAAINSSKVDVNIVSSDVATGGTSAVDDADFTATSTSGTPAMGVYESTPTSVTDGDLGVVGITTGRRLKTSATIDTALPAGTNAIGKLSANSGVDIGDVDVTSISAGDNTIGRVKFTDGTDVADVLDLANSNPIAVAIVDGSGDQISSFGGGTQYTEADTDASITGTAMMMEGAGNALVVAQGTAADGLLVNLGSNNDITGTVTANLSATDNAVLDAIEADTTAIAGAVSGTEMQVDIVSAPTLTVNAHAVTNAGTFAVQESGAALTALQLIDDTVTTLGTDTYTEASSKGITLGAVRRDADTTLVNTTNEFTPLQVDANGRLKVEAFSGETLPVSLTSTTVTGSVAVTQSGTWDEVGINDSGNSITVDNNGTFVTQVDGAALTALQLIDDGVYTDDTSTHSTGSSKGYGIMAAATPTDTSVNANDIGMVAMTTDRRLLVDASGVAVPVTDNSSSLSVDWNGTQPVTGSGTATGALRVELANNGTGQISTVSTVSALGTGTTGPQKAEDVGHSTGDMGIFMLAVRDDTIGPTSGTEGDYEALHTNENGALWVEQDVSTKGGWSVGNFTSGDTYTALTNSAQAIKASAGKFGGYYIYNPNSSATYVFIYDVASGSVTVGTTTAKLVFCIPATSAANLEINKGIPFSTALSIAAATTGGGNTAPATALEALIWYK